ncbi:MAG: DNA mismatch repair protein MutS [Clostridiales bacterium]|nr:DNA mismatch repair protein MutS [Clostridiales bacterium]
MTNEKTKAYAAIPDAKTPMMKQYYEIKAENPGALVMFRLGDFYEFFGEDAHIASKELDIVLTGRDAGGQERMPMCGIPHHALDQYLARLVQNGHRICICEQLEDPKTVKGLVKRGVVRIVTPGTAMEVSGEEESLYIAAVLRGSDEDWAMSLCETSTGRLSMAEFHGAQSLSDLSGEIRRLKPKEILISENDYLVLSEMIRLWEEEEKEGSLITMLPGDRFFRDAGRERLQRQFGGLGEAGRIDDPGSGSSLGSAGSQEAGGFDTDAGIGGRGGTDTPLWLDYPLAGDCAGAILLYLDNTQKAAPVQIRTLEMENPAGCLSMDPTTFRNLEITRNLRSYEKKGSLLDLLDKTRTAFGARLLRQWLERPLTRREAIEGRLDAVEVLFRHWSQRQALRKFLGDLYDMERLMTRVVYQRATPRELLSLRQSFGVLPQIRLTLSEVLEGGEAIPDAKAGEPQDTPLGPSEELNAIFDEIDELQDLYGKLDAALMEDLPVNWKEGGFIKPGYHPEADEYRDGAQNGRSWMLELEQREKEKTGVKSLKVGYNKVFGYYFEVTKSNLGSVPEYFRRKQTLADRERFVTDELIHFEGLVLGAEEKMAALELDLYQDLLLFLSEALPRVQTTASALARLDVFQSLAEAAASGQYCRPHFQESGAIEIRVKDLRHPVVEQIMEHNRFVPNDLAMDEQTSLFIITGPNMGGKSTYCRSVVLAFVMAQAGSFVPAASALLPICDRVFARVGASDDLRGGQSTFMMEMHEVAHILQNATSRSLVILDEVGRGTGTYDGLSVAWAVSHYLIRQIKAKTLFATHYLELTDLAALYPEVKNLSIAVEEDGERIVFLHKILPGSANKSYGIHVARLAGLPEEVIEGARDKLYTLERGDPEPDAGAIMQLSLFEDSVPQGAAAGSAGDRAGSRSVNRAGKQAVDPTADQGTAQTMDPDSAGASDGARDPLISEILSKDIANMTPLDALNYLFFLQKELSAGT